MDGTWEEGGGGLLEVGEEGVAWEVFEEEEEVGFGLEDVVEGAEEGGGVVGAAGDEGVFFEFDMFVHILLFEFLFVDYFHGEERGRGGRRGSGGGRGGGKSL